MSVPSAGASTVAVMVDFDSTIFPLLDAIGAHPDGIGVDYPTMATWAGLTEACGGAEALGRILAEVMTFEWMRQFSPFEGASGTLAGLQRQGVAIQVVSDRPNTGHDDLRDYLAHWRVPADEILCESGIDKVAWCHKRQVNVLIDDHPDTLQRAHDAGLVALGLEFPYNRHVFDRNGLPSANSWAELGRHIHAQLS